MRCHLHFYIDVRDGKKRVRWPALIVFVLGIYVIEVGAAEVFWHLFTGGFSPLIGGYAAVVATLTVIRLIGAGLSMPARKIVTRAFIP
jgi:hypothetical protein